MAGCILLCGGCCFQVEVVVTGLKNEQLYSFKVLTVGRPVPSKTQTSKHTALAHRPLDVGLSSPTGTAPAIASPSPPDLLAIHARVLKGDAGTCHNNARVPRAGAVRTGCK
jgi:hypothetical protein